MIKKIEQLISAIQLTKYVSNTSKKNGFNEGFKVTWELFKTFLK